MESKLISIVVPVYNVQDYLEECIESVLSQTYKKFELILIDDGSTDLSGEICDKYSVLDQRIKVIHQVNKGQQAARSEGIQAAKGEYLVFVDSDDWIADSMLEKLLNEIQGHDLVTSGILRYNQDGLVIEKWMDNLEPGVYKKDSEYLFDNLIIARNYSGGAVIGGIANNIVNKMFKTSLVKKMYLNANIGVRDEEDFLFTILYILQCDSIVVTDYCFYHYRDNSQSVIHTSNMNYLRERNKFYTAFVEAIQGHWKEESLKIQFQRRFVYAVIYGLYNYMGFDKVILDAGCMVPDCEEFRSKNLILFGAGEFGKKVYKKLNQDKSVNVVAWVDNKMAGNVMEGKVITSPHSVSLLEYDIVLCAVLKELHFEEIRKQLIALGVESRHIIWYQPKNLLQELFLH